MGVHRVSHEPVRARTHRGPALLPPSTLELRRHAFPPGASGAPHPRHQPELTVLHQVGRKHLGELLRTLKEEAGALPQFPTRPWRSGLDGWAHLVDRLLRDVKVRPAVPALPCGLWRMLAYQPAFVNAVGKTFP